MLDVGQVTKCGFTYWPEWSRSRAWPIQPPFQWVPSVLSLIMKSTAYPYHSKCVAIPSDLYMPSWHSTKEAQGQVTIYHYHYTVQKATSLLVLLSQFHPDPSTTPSILLWCLSTSAQMLPHSKTGNTATILAYLFWHTHNLSSWNSITKYQHRCHNCTKDREDGHLTFQFDRKIIHLFYTL